MVGAQFGVGFAERLKAEQLRAGLALLVLAVAVRMALGLVVPPADLYAIEAPAVDEEYSPLRLSVLDQSIAVVDRPHGAAIRDTIALAQLCEELGYDRFWLSEHHSNETIVGTAPEILIAAIAAVTKRIRVGSAGIMLPHYSPFKVAEQFRVLDAIAPGRIDLGLGRAPGSDGRTAFALNPLADQRPAQFPADVRDLMAWVTGSAAARGPPVRGRARLPGRRDGAGDLDARQLRLRRAGGGALRPALRVCLVLRRRRDGGAQALDLYRKLYKPSAPMARAAHGAVRVGAGGGDRGGGAVPLLLARPLSPAARPRHLLRARAAGRGAGASVYGAELARIVEQRKAAFVGTGEQVAERIDELARRLDVQEMAVVTWAYDEDVRRASYRLLAKAMGFGPGMP